MISPLDYCNWFPTNSPRSTLHPVHGTRGLNGPLRIVRLGHSPAQSLHLGLKRPHMTCPLSSLTSPLSVVPCTYSVPATQAAWFCDGVGHTLASRSFHVLPPLLWILFLQKSERLVLSSPLGLAPTSLSYWGHLWSSSINHAPTENCPFCFLLLFFILGLITILPLSSHYESWLVLSMRLSKLCDISHLFFMLAHLWVSWGRVWLWALLPAVGPVCPSPGR